MSELINMAAFIAFAGAVIGMFLRIEHRLTKVETKIDFIQEHIPGCQPRSGDHTK